MEEQRISGCDSNLTNDENCDLTSDNETLPLRLGFTFIYCLMFGIAAMGNLTVFVTLSRRRHQKSRMSLMMRHLAAADLVVTFLTIPLEVSWLLAARWMAENSACHFFLALQAFGLYLSRNVLICVSLDRYLAIFHPQTVSDALRCGKIMLTVAWICSLIYALPPIFAIHVSHPAYTKFRQCVTFRTSVNHAAEIANNVFCVVIVYFVPVTIICYTCTRILSGGSSNIRGPKQEVGISGSDDISTVGMETSRMPKISTIKRTKDTTLRVTIAIVTAFVICWTPYVVLTLWYTFDRESSPRDDTWLLEYSFILAVGNSCVNPVICGSYVIDCRRERTRCSCCLSRAPEENHDVRLEEMEDTPYEELLRRRSETKKVRFA